MSNKKEPLISVLMPAYNAEKYIGKAIQSIISQTYTNWELLVCDDGSTDKTHEFATSFKDDRIKVFKNITNLKKPKTTNWLFTQSKGDLITIHDADDLSHKNRFDEIVNIFSKNNDLYICGHDIQRISESGKKLPLFRSKVSDYEKIKSSMLKENTDGDPSLFIKREVINSLCEIYRPYFTNSMDYDFALRAIEKYKSSNLKKVLSYYRNVPNSISKGVTSYKKFIMPGMSLFFAYERAQKGFDSLEKGDWDTITKEEEKLSRPYAKDESLYLIKMAEFHMYYRMNKQAIAYAWSSVIKDPLRIRNWNTFQYCLRKTIFTV